ncbi:MAG: hypothetical protein LBK70_02925 [Clostridiales bacterium]|jgi:hypothetical protein|nr:hypothetical protein [Clostridiales bacterium]
MSWIKNKKALLWSSGCVAFAIVLVLAVIVPLYNYYHFIEVDEISVYSYNTNYNTLYTSKGENKVAYRSRGSDWQIRHYRNGNTNGNKAHLIQVPKYLVVITFY